MWDLCGLGSEPAHCHIHLAIVVEVSHKGFRGVHAAFNRETPQSEMIGRSKPGESQCNQYSMAGVRKKSWIKQDASYWPPSQESELDGRTFVVLPGLPSAQIHGLALCLASIYSDWAVPMLFWLLKLVNISFPLFTTNHILEVFNCSKFLLSMSSWFWVSFLAWFPHSYEYGCLTKTLLPLLKSLHGFLYSISDLSVYSLIPSN